MNMQELGYLLYMESQEKIRKDKKIVDEDRKVNVNKNDVSVAESTTTKKYKNWFRKYPISIAPPILNTIIHIYIYILDRL